MKKIFKWSILLSISTLGVIPLTVSLSSCGINMPVNQNPQNLVSLNYTIDHPNSKLLSKTVDEWKNELFNKNYKLFIDALQDTVNNLEELKFDFNNINNLRVEFGNNINSSPILGTLEINIFNSTQKLNLKIHNLYNFATSYWLPPTLGLDPKKPIELNQYDMSYVNNIDPNLVKDSQWYSAVNLKSTSINQAVNPGAPSIQLDKPVIPFNLYSLKSRGHDLNDSKYYWLVFSVNSEYNDILNQLPNRTQFKDIYVKIKISPYIGKEFLGVVTMDSASIKKFIGQDVGFDNFESISHQQIYNGINQYIESLSIYQPLRPEVLNSQMKFNNYSIQKLSLSKRIILSFSTSFENTTNSIYSYTINLNF